MHVVQPGKRKRQKMKQKVQAGNTRKKTTKNAQNYSNQDNKKDQKIQK